MPPEPDDAEGSTLDALAQRGRERLAAESFQLDAARRALLAYAVRGGGTLFSAFTVLVTLGILFAGIYTDHPIGGVISAVAVGLACIRMRQHSDTSQIKTELDWPASLPFPLKDYGPWLAGERSHILVRFRDEPDQALLTEAVAGLGAHHRASWRDARTASVWLLPKTVGTYDVGDTTAMRRLVNEVLRPADGRWGVIEVACIDPLAGP